MRFILYAEIWKFFMSFPRCEVTPCDVKTYPIGKQIGGGNFCTVHKSEEPVLGLPVAVKIFPKDAVRRLRKEKDVLMEKHSLARLDHENVVKLVRTWYDIENLYIVTELCAGGELWQSCRLCGEPEARAKVYFKQILKGISYMHRIGIVHRDLKAENIFLSRNGSVVKIGDLGSSRDLFNPAVTGAGNQSGGGRRVMHNYVGTPNFMAPEAIDDKENDCLSDIWSLGCTFYQVLVGIPPFVAGSEYLVYLRVKELDLVFPESGMSPDANTLIRRIITLSRQDRPSLKSIEYDPFFKDTPSAVPPMTLTDISLQTIARDESVNIDSELISKFPAQADRLRKIAQVREWVRLSRPGAGTALVDHLLAAEDASSES